MPTIQFHVMTDSQPDAHLRHACRIAEEAVASGQRVFVRVADAAQLKRMDELLWTFGDRSFLPHEIANTQNYVPTNEHVRVLIGADAALTTDMVINLGIDAPNEFESLKQIIELVPADDERKRLARQRFKHYRDAGIEPTTQNVLRKE